MDPKPTSAHQSPSEGDCWASAQHSRSRYKKRGGFAKRAVDWRLRSGGQQWALRWDRAALSLRGPAPTSERAISSRLETRFSIAPIPDPHHPLTQGKPAPGRNRRRHQTERAPYRVTADPGRGKDHPRPPAHQEMSRGPGQGLGNLYTWGCTLTDLYRQEVPSPGCWLLCSTMDTWWEQVRPAGRASHRAQCWADMATSRGELGDGGQEPERGRQVQNYLWSGYMQRPWHQPCGTLCASQANGLSPCSAAQFLSHRQAPPPLNTHTHTHIHPHTFLIHPHTHTLSLSHTHTHKHRAYRSLDTGNTGTQGQCSHTRHMERVGTAQSPSWAQSFDLPHTGSHWDS